MGLFLVTVIVIAGVMLIMAVGLFFKYPCLRVECGGPDVEDNESESIRCEV